MSQVAELKSRLATLDKIIAEARASRRLAEDALDEAGSREAKRQGRSINNDDLRRRFPSLGKGVK